MAAASKGIPTTIEEEVGGSSFFKSQSSQVDLTSLSGGAISPSKSTGTHNQSASSSGPLLASVPSPPTSMPSSPTNEQSNVSTLGNSSAIRDNAASSATANEQKNLSTPGNSSAIRDDPASFSTTELFHSTSKAVNALSLPSTSTRDQNMPDVREVGNDKNLEFNNAQTRFNNVQPISADNRNVTSMTQQELHRHSHNGSVLADAQNSMSVPEDVSRSTTQSNPQLQQQQEQIVSKSPDSRNYRRQKNYNDDLVGRLADIAFGHHRYKARPILSAKTCPSSSADMGLLTRSYEGGAAVFIATLLAVSSFHGTLPPLYFWIAFAVVPPTLTALEVHVPHRLEEASIALGIIAIRFALLQEH